MSVAVYQYTPYARLLQWTANGLVPFRPQKGVRYYVVGELDEGHTGIVDVLTVPYADVSVPACSATQSLRKQQIADGPLADL